MEYHRWLKVGFLIFIGQFVLSGCASNPNLLHQIASGDYNGEVPLYQGQAPYSSSFNEDKYELVMPQKIHMGKEKVVLVDPTKLAWGAYDSNGDLVRAGVAVLGGNYCDDVGRSCRTSTGTFRVTSLGGPDCVSKKYPIPRGGAFMPYCMFFHNGESLHGEPDQMMHVSENISHGCVRMRIPDAEWLRYDFVRVGTKVVILPY